MIYQSQLSRSFVLGLLLAIAAPLLSVFGHGGEDHGDAKPKSTASVKGVVSHSIRLGDMELMVKHPVLLPDQTASAQLFITTFGTNEPIKGATPKIEVESSGGRVFPATVQTGEQAGSFSVQLPALPDGSYQMRVNVAHDGETDTATISGVEVKQAAVEEAGAASWSATVMIAVVFVAVLLLLISLIYIVWRSAAGTETDGGGALPA